VAIPASSVKEAEPENTGFSPVVSGNPYFGISSYLRVSERYLFNFVIPDIFYRESIFLFTDVNRYTLTVCPEELDLKSGSLQSVPCQG
jgi:hypothetical protein